MSEAKHSDLEKAIFGVAAATFSHRDWRIVYDGRNGERSERHAYVQFAWNCMERYEGGGLRGYSVYGTIAIKKLPVIDRKKQTVIEEGEDYPVANIEAFVDDRGDCCEALPEKLHLANSDPLGKFVWLFAGSATISIVKNADYEKNMYREPFTIPQIFAGMEDGEDGDDSAQA